MGNEGAQVRFVIAHSESGTNPRCARTRRRCGEITKAAITETLRRERLRCVSTGVWPRGAQLRRTSGQPSGIPFRRENRAIALPFV